ncbi:hypothetical protein B0J17DRAFT_660170 [Rhizoctonia solani]|nr:hypothetical protein B0J17DRAFT_660170 [Rhizoctonia solani]
MIAKYYQFQISIEPWRLSTPGQPSTATRPRAGFRVAHRTHSFSASILQTLRPCCSEVSSDDGV